MKLINYAGTKLKYTDQINLHINKSDKSIYIEPFLGSASVFINLEKRFDLYILNDINRNVIRIFKSFKHSTYELLLECLNVVNEKFGDIKSDKEAYYNFRNTFNKKVWMSDTDVEGFYLYLLYISCLNSMPRFGPSGFNQSFGNRLTLIKREDFNTIQNKLKDAILENLDFFKLIDKYSDKIDESCLFLDPPYFEKQTGNYDKIDKTFFDNFIEFCKETDADIVYTDTEHSLLNNYHKEEIRLMSNISPNRKTEKTISEFLYTNIN